MKIPKEELNGIFLHAVPHRSANQEMLLGFDFQSETFRAALELFGRMEIAESIYEGAG